jgi:nicotinate phosphoribosyltransferase
LGGVYKLSALKRPDGTWEPKLKLSEQSAKATHPGILQVRRFRTENEFVGDALYDIGRPLPEEFVIVDAQDPLRRKRQPQEGTSEDLLIPLFRDGRPVIEPPPISSIRTRAQSQLGMLNDTVRRLDHPHAYPAGIELGLHHRKVTLIRQARGDA